MICESLIDEAHARGLMVFLDVVYNHFGPEGNYLAPLRAGVLRGCPHAVGPRHRLSAFHRSAPSRSTMRSIGSSAIVSTVCGSTPFMRSSKPEQPSILMTSSRAVGHFAAATGRMIHLVLENDDNRASLLDPWTQSAAR